MIKYVYTFNLLPTLIGDVCVVLALLGLILGLKKKQVMCDGRGYYAREQSKNTTAIFTHHLPLQDKSPEILLSLKILPSAL